MDIDIDAITEIIENFRKGDDRSLKLLWRVGSIILTMLVTVAIFICYKFSSTADRELLTLLFIIIIFICAVTIYIIILNDRLKTCINQCLRIRALLVFNEHDEVKKKIMTLCTHKMNIKELKSVIPANPLGNNND